MEAPARPKLHEDALTEIIGGEVVEKVVSPRACRIASRLNTRLETFLDYRELGMTFLFCTFALQGKALVRRPYIAFVSAERWPLGKTLPDEDNWEFAPDLAVEVVGPGDTVENVTAAVADYFHYGTRQVWLVHMAIKRIDVYDAPDKFRIVHEGDNLETSLVPGWKLSLTSLFQV